MVSVTDWNNRVTAYEYNNNGRLTKETRPDGTSQEYTYNIAGQLTGTTDEKADGSIINKYDYEYDADGNIITEDSLSNPNYANITIPSNNMEYSSANRLVDFNGTAISYDNDGNMLYTPLKDNKWAELHYNSRNILTDVTTSDDAIAVYGYDAENYRISKTENGIETSYVVDPNAELSQVLMSTTNGETTYYIYGLGLIAQENTDGYKTYHYDYRGSTTAITDNNGNVTDRVYYDAYGSIINRTGATNAPFLYVGKYGVETDDDGLYYMRARYYNPLLQRFVNVDPIENGLNWYSYVVGNPIILIDSYGYKGEAIILKNNDDLRNYYIQLLEECISEEKEYQSYILMKQYGFSKSYYNSLFRLPKELEYIDNYLEKHPNAAIIEQVRNREKCILNLWNNFCDSNEIICDGIIYDVPILTQEKNECWLFSEIAAYSWYNDLKLNFIQARNIASEVPDEKKYTETYVGGEIEKIKGGNTAEDGHITHYDYDSVRMKLESGPMYANIKNNSNNAIDHSVIVVGCYKTIDNNLYIIYNDNYNRQVTTTMDDFYKEINRSNRNLCIPDFENFIFE